MNENEYPYKELDLVFKVSKSISNKQIRNNYIDRRIFDISFWENVFLSWIKIYGSSISASMDSEFVTK